MEETGGNIACFDEFYTDDSIDYQQSKESREDTDESEDEFEVNFKNQTEFFQYPTQIADSLEKLDILKNKIGLNTVLLERLKRDLVHQKVKFAENSTRVNNVRKTLSFLIFRVLIFLVDEQKEG